MSSCTLRSRTRSPGLIRPPTRILRRLWHLRRRAPISTSSVHHRDAPHTNDTTPQRSRPATDVPSQPPWSPVACPLLDRIVSPSFSIRKASTARGNPIHHAKTPSFRAQPCQTPPPGPPSSGSVPAVAFCLSGFSPNLGRRAKLGLCDVDLVG